MRFVSPKPGTSVTRLRSDGVRVYAAQSPGGAIRGDDEVLQPGGSVEYNNAEAGAVWIQRLLERFPKHAWLNPEPEAVWQYRQSIALLQQITRQRMYPVTLAGLERATRELVK